MRKLTYLFLAAILLSAISVSAADTPLLPGHFGSWQSSSPSKFTSGQALKAFFGQDPRDQVLREAGLTSIEERVYRGENKEINLHLYTFGDPTGAFQYFTQTTSTLQRTFAYGDESAFDAHNGNILLGNLVVFIGSANEMKPQELAGLDTRLHASADRTPYPPLREYLSKQDLLYGTQKYSDGPAGFRYAMLSNRQSAFQELANVVGFEDKVESMLAKYQSGHDSAVLLLLLYPTPQIAEKHLHHLTEALPAAARQAGVNVERKGSMLSLVLESSSREYAQKIRSAVNYETQVTWNETGHAATDPPIVVVLVKILVFTLGFLGFATGMGILFGVARIMIKRLFPGKIFDRPQDIEVLQMGLSGKKIDPSDMY